ncbi:hypothetical protein SAMN05661096_00217 [Marivirga sericea]|uniref:Uncharacterized protein n=1 Tax=Marivirga sericea TaxID=1028 RepID=A0A1X7I603_9BACT|nr:hypothetical protein [Marivirga sericea]SMG09462.1 hypothetical protein SAMN05661096_00217 [Marivirga sericea]
MKKLSDKMKKERELSFLKWLEEKDTLIKNWLRLIPDSFSNGLDYSLESLVLLSDYLILNYKMPESTESLTNQDEMMAVSGYIGEVYIRNIPGNKEWIMSELTPRKNNKFEFFYLVGERNKDQINPFSAYIPSLIYSKDNQEIYLSLKAIKNNSEEFIKKSNAAKVIPGKGGFSYQYFILVKDESFELNEIEQALKIYYAKKGSRDRVYSHNERHLLVNMGDNYYFHFQLDTGEGVLQESKEIAENYKGDKDKSVIASCKSRVEFWGDEDPDGDYINDHMYLLEQLMQNAKLLIFDFRNGVFYDEQ